MPPGQPILQEVTILNMMGLGWVLMIVLVVLAVTAIFFLVRRI